MPQAQLLYLNSNEHLRQGNEVETREERKNKELRELYPLHGLKRSAPIMHRIRSRKTGGGGADASAPWPSPARPSSAPVASSGPV
jgi:hypothetical protein